MQSTLKTALAILLGHPAPALRLSELHRLLIAELGHGRPAVSRLRSALEGRPDRFRVLDPWRGVWRALPAEASPKSFGEPWVVAVPDPVGSEEPTRCTDLSRRLRTSVRWLGLGIDASSPREVARWHEVALSETRTRAALVRAA